MTAADQSLAAFCHDLAARTPTPGGGGAAAVAAAVAAALGAMAASYTTGKRFAEHAAEAAALANDLSGHAQQLLTLVDADAEAFANLKKTWANHDLSKAEVTAIQDRARELPAQLVHDCANAAMQLSEFTPRCNPTIVSDALAAVHLLAGAARAAWQTFLINQPTPAQRGPVEDALMTLERCDQAALHGASA